MYLCVFVLEANTHQIHTSVFVTPLVINPRRRAHVAHQRTAMPPVANPNPDRARRGAVSTGEAKDEVVPEPLRRLPHRSLQALQHAR